MKKRLVLILGIVAVAAAGFAYGVHEYYRRSGSLADSPAAFFADAKTLEQEFAADESASTLKYAGKIVTTAGTIKDISRVAKGRVKVELAGDGGLPTVSCSMDSCYEAVVRLWVPGEGIRVKGLLTGFDRDETGWIGSDIQLIRCVPQASGAR